MLPSLPATGPITEKRRAIFGIITSNIQRIAHLLGNLCAASESRNCDFNPFVIVFANCSETNLKVVVAGELKKDAFVAMFSREMVQ